MNYGGRIEVGKFRTPKNYIANQRRKYKPGPDNRVENY